MHRIYRKKFIFLILKVKENEQMKCINECQDMVRDWDDRDRDWHRDKDKDCCIFPKHPKPKKIFLECGTRPQDAIFEIRRGRVRRRQRFILDRVIVDTSCLCRPQVKIEFSSIVYFKAFATTWGGSGAAEEAEERCIEEGEEMCVEEETEAEVQCGNKEVEVDLRFELIRICNGVEETVQEWRYLKEFEIDNDDNLEVEISEPFTVTYCDRECPGCCVYKMRVRGRDFDGRFDALRVVTPNISALAQGICGD